jgi:RNA recognition motif-containing protein
MFFISAYKKTACSQFGEVIGCEVFYDRTGRSVGEAEVEFATKVAALDCIAKLDNESADGKKK